MRARRTWPLLLVITLPSIGCVARMNRVVERVSHKLEVSGEPTIIVESRSGAVEVVGGKDGEITISAEKSASQDADLDHMRIEITQKNGEIKLTWDVDDGKTRGRNVNFKLRAPRPSSVRIASGGGTVKLRALEKGAKVNTSGGSIDVKDVKGDLALQTGGGSIDVEEAAGSVVALSGGGWIEVDGRLLGASKIHTGGGSIRVRIPETSNLDVAASTAGGSLRNEFGLKSLGKDPRRFNGMVGDGSEGRLDITSGGGSVSLRKL